MDGSIGRWGIFLPQYLGIALATQACREWGSFAVLN